MTDSPCVVFVPGPDPSASFVAADRRLLATLADVVELPPGRGVGPRLAFAARLSVTLARRRPALVVLWFASPTYGVLTALQCRAAAVPWLVVAGGADVANRPGIGFGDARRTWRRRAVSLVLEGARDVWAFSVAAAAEIRAISPSAAVRVVPPVVDTPFFRRQDSAREPLVLSACARVTPLTLRQKGIDRLMAVARIRPALAFVVVGQVEPASREVRALIATAPPNVRFAGFVSREALRGLYARAGAYLQLSDHEGFGVAVAEALAMGCRPVTTDLAAIAETVGPRGCRVPLDATPEQVADAVDSALASSADHDAWQDVDRRFGPDVRDRAWRQVFADLGLHPAPPGQRAD